MQLRLYDNLLVPRSADRTVKVWDTLTANRLLTLGSNPSGTGSPIQAVQHDSTKLIIGAEGAIQTWDIRTGQLLDETKEEVEVVWQLAFLIAVDALWEVVLLFKGLLVSLRILFLRYRACFKYIFEFLKRDIIVSCDK